VVGDFNGDNKVDLAVANYGAQTVSVLLGNGDGTFQGHADYGSGSNPLSLAVGDFDGNGRLDLAVANYSQGKGNGTVSVLFPPTTTVTIKPSSLTFADQVLGRRSDAQTVTLTNSGKRKLTISNIVVTGTDAADFGEKNRCGSSLPPGAHCIIKVTFKPIQVGPRTASVTFTDSGNGSPQTVALNGTGVTSGPNATLSPTSLTFYCFKFGKKCACTPSQQITLTNYGKKWLRITNITITGSTDFSQTNNCGTSLGPGKSCTITVSWNHVTSSGAVKVTDNAPNSPQTASLTGTNRCQSQAGMDTR
jgi:hypothetical protein